MGSVIYKGVKERSRFVEDVDDTFRKQISSEESSSNLRMYILLFF